MREEVRFLEQAIERANAALIGVVDPVERRRRLTWKLRVQGYTLDAIAENLNVSNATAYRDLEWCYKNLPQAYETVDEFRHMTILQYEYLFQYLTTPRTELEQTEAGDTITHMVMPSRMDILAAREIKKEQTLLLGAYRPARETDGGGTVTYSVTVARQIPFDAIVGEAQMALEAVTAAVGSSPTVSPEEGVEDV